MTTAAELLARGRGFKRKAAMLFGEPLIIRSLSGSERDLMRSRAADNDPLKPSEVVAMAALNEDGEPLFTLEQVAELGACDGGEIDRLSVEIMDLSGLMPKAEADAEKN